MRSVARAIGAITCGVVLMVGGVSYAAVMIYNIGKVPHTAVKYTPSVYVGDSIGLSWCCMIKPQATTGMVVIEPQFSIDNAHWSPMLYAGGAQRLNITVSDTTTAVTARAINAEGMGRTTTAWSSAHGPYMRIKLTNSMGDTLDLCQVAIMDQIP